MAANPIDQWKASNGYAATYGMQQQQHCLDGLSPYVSSANCYQNTQSIAMALQQCTPKSSPECTPSGQSSLANSPAQSPTVCDGNASPMQPLNAVKLPRVMSAGEARMHRRRQATKREARRAIAIRKAFTSLEECLPGHEERSFTRLEILDLATTYIRDLTTSLKQNSGGSALRKAATKLVSHQQRMFQQQQQLDDAAGSQTQPPQFTGVPATATPLSSMSARVDTPPAETCPASAHQPQAQPILTAANVLNNSWPTYQLGHANTSMPLSHGAAPLPAPHYQHNHIRHPLNTIQNQALTSCHLALAGDLKGLEISDLFQSPDGPLSDCSSNWSDILDESLAEGLHTS